MITEIVLVAAYKVLESCLIGSSQQFILEFKDNLLMGYYLIQ